MGVEKGIKRGESCINKLFDIANKLIGKIIKGAITYVTYINVTPSVDCNSPFRLRVRGMQFSYVTSQLTAFAHPQ